MISKDVLLKGFIQGIRFKVADYIFTPLFYN